MTDANQRWDVGQAIEWMKPMAKFNVTWIEEPTSPDDVLGHRTISQVRSLPHRPSRTWNSMKDRKVVFVTLSANFTWMQSQWMACVRRVILQALAPYGIGVATGESCQNRVVFKQFLQSGALQFAQIDSCRLAGPNEILAVYLMARKLNGMASDIPNKPSYTILQIIYTLYTRFNI